MLRLDGVRIVFENFSLEADLSIPARRFVALMGPSGAGKSTLLGAVAGFVEIAAGEVHWQDQRLDRLGPPDRPVAMLFQDNNLFPHLTVLQNVALALTQKVRVPADVARRAEEALSQVGLARFGERKPGTLSGGQQSRVALARVLLQDKPLVLLDEPFSALGPGQRAEMMTLCRDVLGAAGRTVLFVSHDPADAAAADETCVVAEGKMSPPVPARQLLDNPPDVLKAYLGK